MKLVILTVYDVNKFEQSNYLLLKSIAE